METNSFTSGESVKRDQALKVFMLLQDKAKMSQAKACETVGIDPKTYRKWIATQEEVLQKFEQARREAERLEYAGILARKSAITDNFLQQAMKPGVPLSERIKALEHIDERLDVLSSRYHIVDVEAEQDLLSGPTQLPGTSKLANRVAGEEKENSLSNDRANEKP